ncbi:MAG: hypothetical protein WCD16_08285 [Paracoccaceae bacterium]
MQALLLFYEGMRPKNEAHRQDRTNASDHIKQRESSMSFIDRNDQDPGGRGRGLLAEVLGSVPALELLALMGLLAFVLVHS